MPKYRDVSRFSLNPWELIFRKGIPSDLIQPYKGFKTIVDYLKKNKAKKVLDVASGSGRHASALARIGFEIYGFDLSESAIELTYKIFETQNLTGNFMVADMFENFPYEKEYFDAVIAIQAIYHGKKNEMQKALDEIARVLKQNGCLIFTVSLSKERSALGALEYKGKKLDEHTFIPLVGREKGLVHYYPTRKELSEMLSVKFTHVRISEDKENKYFVIYAKRKKN